MPKRSLRPTKVVNRNQYGQAMGSKGLLTRRRLVDATANLLERKPLRSIRVSDVSRAAKTAPSTFYLYFNDVEDAVLAVTTERHQSTPEIVAILEHEWSGASAIVHCRAFVEAYVKFWEDNFAILRVRNLTADEGDTRFIEARIKSQRPILDALTLKIEYAQRAGRVSGDIFPFAGAGVIMAMLERLGTVTRTASGRAGITRARLVEAAARFITSSLGGERG